MGYLLNCNVETHVFGVDECNGPTVDTDWQWQVPGDMSVDWTDTGVLYRWTTETSGLIIHISISDYLPASDSIVDRVIAFSCSFQQFWWSDTTSNILNTHYDEKYQQFKMAAAKPEVVITLDLLQIEMWFQVLLPCFQGSR